MYNPFSNGWYTGACFPGMKLNVYPDGSFHICERVNHHFSIGDCWNGLNSQRICALMSQYAEQVFSDCDNCIAQRFCRACWATVGGEGTFNKEKVCQTTQKVAIETLALVCSILEENRQAFDEIPRIYQENPFLWY